MWGCVCGRQRRQWCVADCTAPCRVLPVKPRSAGAAGKCTKAAARYVTRAASTTVGLAAAVHVVRESCMFMPLRDSQLQCAFGLSVPAHVVREQVARWSYCQVLLVDCEVVQLIIHL
jgi:hypothetical protein